MARNNVTAIPARGNSAKADPVEIRNTTSETAEIGMEGVEYLRGLFDVLIALCERGGDMHASNVLSIARAGKHIADDYHNTLDCIRETAEEQRT